MARSTTAAIVNTTRRAAHHNHHPPTAGIQSGPAVFLDPSIKAADPSPDLNTGREGVMGRAVSGQAVRDRIPDREAVAAKI